MESSLAVNLYDLQAEVGDSAGFGRGARFNQPPWDDVQQGQIDASVNTGLRWVYFTQAFQDVPASYDWSFLAPTADLTLGADADVLALPDDFGGLREIVPASANRNILHGLRVVGEDQFYGAQLQNPGSVGAPRLVFIEWLKATGQNRGQRARLRVFPTSDGSYPLKVWYDILPDALSSALPYVYGGAAHAETFLAAVRAAYESKYLNGAQGTEQAKFQERLRSSIQYDRKYKPIQRGPNLDRSDGPHYIRPDSIHFRYAGIQPG